MKRFVMAVVALACTAAFADAQCGMGSRLFSGSHPIRTALFGTSTASACGSASAVGACSSATGTCSAGKLVQSEPTTPAATADAAMRPLVYDMVRLSVHRKLVKGGMSHADATAETSGLTNSVIDGSLKQLGVKVGAFGDGTILQEIIAFIESAQGQALIALLIKLITGG